MGKLRDSDRFWWTCFLVSALVLMYGALIDWSFWLAFKADSVIVDASGNFVPAPIDTSSIVLLVFLAVIILGLAAFIVEMGVSTRKRHLARLDAWRNGADRMPLAAIYPGPTPMPDVSAQPLDLRWRATRKTVVMEWLVLVLAILYVLSFAFILYLTLSTPIARANSLPGAQVPGIPILGVGAFRLLPYWVRSRRQYISALTGKSFGIRATADGIEQVAPGGAHIFIRWDELRLFEVIRERRQTRGYFALYAPGKSIIWFEYSKGIKSEEYIPDGLTDSEMGQRQEALLALIAAKTGLEPRTFLPDLQRSNEGIPATQGMDWRVATLFAMIFAAMAVGEYFFPVTPYLWVNLASSISLLAMAGLLVYFACVIAIHRRRAPTEPPSVAAPAPAMLDDGRMFALTWRAPRSYAAGIIVGILLMAVNIIPCVMFTSQAFNGGDQPGNPALTPDAILLGIMLLLVSLVGAGGVIATLVMAAKGDSWIPATAIRAEMYGLRVDTSTQHRFIAWRDIREVVWRPNQQGNAPGYLVTTTLAARYVAWPTAPRYLDTAIAPAGAWQIGPDELAALVAARTGLPIRVME